MPVIETYTARIRPSAGQVPQLPVGAAAAPAQQIAGIGEVMTKFGMAFLGKLSEAEDMMELSTLDRRAHEINNATFQAMSTEFDPDVRRQLSEKGKQDLSGLVSQIKRPNVQRTFQSHLDRILPQWDAEFFNLDNKLRIERLRADKKVNDDYDLEHGRKEDYIKRQMAMTLAGDQTPEETKFFIENFDKNSTLAQAHKMILSNQPAEGMGLLAQLPDKELSVNQLKLKNAFQKAAEQQAQINTDQIQNEIVFGMFDNRNKTLAEKQILGSQYIGKLRTTPGLSAADARVMTNRVEDWMAGKERINDSLVYTKLFRDVTQLHRGIGRAEQIRRSIVAAYPNLDDQHFESLNKYLDETVEGWNADILRRLEKEAQPHLAPNMAMWERFMQMPPADQQRYKSLIDRLHEPAKRDADRLALYLNQCRKWIVANPEVPNFYENGRRIMSQFERYTDDQIQQMEKQLEKEAEIVSPVPTPEELRKQNTKEAYQKGIELGYWK